MRKLLPGLLVFSALAQDSGNVIVRPREIDDVLVNPGMGITTFQRFNGEAINAGNKWSEEGPAEKISPAPAPPDFPETSIAYLRWFWSQIEPRRGSYRWDVIDLALDQAREHHQTLAIRIMPYDGGHPLPQWYQDSGARRANKPSDKDGKVWSPDSSDPLYIKTWGELVRLAGARYDGHPYLDSVDISTIGYWGEGWGPYPPDWSVQKELVDGWLQAFHRTPLLMNFDLLEALRYGTQNGAGWRLDCWGDMGWKWSDDRNFAHMLDRYPEQLVRAGAEEIWRRSPVSLETCGTPGEWKERGFNVDYILAQALRWHAASINIKSSAIPPEWKAKFEDFQKKLGYRFVLRRLEYPREARPGGMMPVSMWWLNAGVAPVYRDYGLALEFHSAAVSRVVRTGADVRKWLPGDAIFESTVYVPDDLAPGTYRMRVALLDPRTLAPAIRLAIAGRQPDGWYDVGEITLR